MKGIKLLSVCAAVPEKRVTNEELSQTVDTSDEWIASRTGIRSRHFVTTETNADLAISAAKKAIAAAKIQPDEIVCCVVATFTPDNFTPSVACKVAGALGLSKIPAFDLNAACAGFIYGLNVVRGLLAANGGGYALLIGSEVISRLLDFNDRNTCVLFGDGAGAAVVALSDKRRFDFVCDTQSDDAVLYSKALPNGEQAFPSIQMQGNDVFRFAVESVEQCINLLLERNGLTLQEIDHIVCHQANRRIIAHVQKKLKIPDEKLFINLDKYGNTSAASIPLALSEMLENGKIKQGDRLICVGFGAGLVWGGMFLEW